MTFGQYVLRQLRSKLRDIWRSLKRVPKILLKHWQLTLLICSLTPIMYGIYIGRFWPVYFSIAGAVLSLLGVVLSNMYNNYTFEIQRAGQEAKKNRQRLDLVRNAVEAIKSGIYRFEDLPSEWKDMVSQYLTEEEKRQ